ncbi:MAG: CvpA family protein [Fibrobacter sp.]|nr:CvpA family protein [Fibrobacter sp.]
MNWIDISCLACLIIFGVIGYWRGLLNSVFRLCAWVAAILGAYFAQSLFSGYVVQNFAFSDFTARLICTCVGFLIPFLLFSFIGHLVGDSIKDTIVGKTNHVLGLLFGLLKASLICFAFLFVLHLLPVEGNLKETRNSAVAYSICKSAIVTMGYSSDEVDLRQMAKEKATELTKTITDKAKGSTEEVADSAKAAVKNAADSVATKVTETAEKAKDAAIAAKDAAVKKFNEGKSSASQDTSKIKK